MDQRRIGAQQSLRVAKPRVLPRAAFEHDIGLRGQSHEPRGLRLALQHQRPPPRAIGRPEKGITVTIVWGLKTA